MIELLETVDDVFAKALLDAWRVERKPVRIAVAHRLIEDAVANAMRRGKKRHADAWKKTSRRWRESLENELRVEGWRMVAEMDQLPVAVTMVRPATGTEG